MMIDPSDVGRTAADFRAEAITPVRSNVLVKSDSDSGLGFVIGPVARDKRYPPALSPGGTVHFVALSDRLSSDSARGIRAFSTLLEREGFRTSMSPVLKLDPKGTGETSSQEFARVVSDPSIQVVFLAKGRESAVRVLEDLEDENIDWNNAPPKVIVGSGRSTAILNGITLRTGLVTFLGCEPRVTEFSTYMSPFAQACFTRRFGPDSEPQTLRFSPPDPTSKEVVARAPSGGTTTVEGRLFGGDIHEFESLLLSGEGRSLAGAILVFESQGHSVNQFESAVWALKRAKVLQDCRAVILGDVDFTGGGKPDRMAAIAHVLNATQRCGIPVMHTGSFGPKLPGIFLPIGGTVTIDFNEGTIHIPRSCV